jgi:hypothetical protein
MATPSMHEEMVALPKPICCYLVRVAVADDSVSAGGACALKLEGGRMNRKPNRGQRPASSLESLRVQICGPSRCCLRPVQLGITPPY